MERASGVSRIGGSDAARDGRAVPGAGGEAGAAVVPVAGRRTHRGLCGSGAWQRRQLDDRTLRSYAGGADRGGGLCDGWESASPNPARIFWGEQPSRLERPNAARRFDKEICAAARGHAESVANELRVTGRAGWARGIVVSGRPAPEDTGVADGI